MDQIIIFSIFAAILALDMTAFGQFMFSRPIVCAPLFGYFLGDIRSGLWIGMIAELIWLRQIPIGAYVPPDSMAISILTVIWGLKSGGGNKSVLMLAFALAIPFGHLSKKVDTWARGVNTKLARWVERGILNGDLGNLDIGVAGGLGLFFAKSFIFYIFAIITGKYILLLLIYIIPEQIFDGLRLAWFLLPIAGFSVALVNFHQTFLGENNNP